LLACVIVTSKVKQEMYDQHCANPEEWTVPKLATSFGCSQPRVQAILLLKEWEAKDRQAGLITPEHDLIEDLVRTQGVVFV
jgi:hypothetical protein